eukprot:INCI2315.1.p1 GENE.INCI2315.1~~INCI2315.1.p1  ORF type:complete len:458 (+),score=55.22 INCI2315.1:88-1374(+)
MEEQKHTRFDVWIAAGLLRMQALLGSLPGADDARRVLSGNPPSSYAHDSFHNASVKRGDIILTATPGYTASAARALAGVTHDHVAVVTRGGSTPQVVHIGPPLIRLVPLQSYMKPDRCPVLLRPKCFASPTSSGLRAQALGAEYEHLRKSGRRSGSGDELSDFVARVESFVGKQYSVTSASQLLVQTVVKRHTSFQLLPKAAIQANTPDQSQSDPSEGNDERIPLRAISEPHHICTDVIFHSLFSNSAAFRETVRRDGVAPELDFCRQGCASVGDLQLLVNEVPRESKQSHAQSADGIPLENGASLTRSHGRARPSKALRELFEVVHFPTASDRAAAKSTANRNLRVILFSVCVLWLLRRGIRTVRRLLIAVARTVVVLMLAASTAEVLNRSPNALQGVALSAARSPPSALPFKVPFPVSSSTVRAKL